MICDNLTVSNKGHLVFAGADTVTLAEKYGTPAYFIDENKIREKCRIYKTALSECFGEGSFPLFASKSLCFKQLYRIIDSEGLGIDVVSAGELFVAWSAGFPMEKAYFHGNNKTWEEISFAMDKGIGYFICDNPDELAAIEKQAESRNITQKILLRLTPGIDPHTHKKISTGSVDSKFGSAIATGQAMSITRQALAMEHIELCGFHCHVGSQIFDTQPFTDAAKIMIDFIAQVKAETGFEAKILNLGGGMGVRYVESDPQIDYAANIRKIADIIKDECVSLGINIPNILMEPGRSIVADSGITLYTAGGKKEIAGVRNYVSIDGGMTDNPRYTLYGSAYTVLNAGKMNEKADYECTIAGKCCESGDLIQENVKIADVQRGDIIAVCTTGAYNYTMSSNYNSIAKPPIIMVDNGESYVAVERESFEDMVKNHI